jgi:hypothetical protein
MVYRPFEEARAFVHSLNLKNGDEWRAFCKGQIPKKGTLPAGIPANPNQTYSKSGWSGMGNWLGTGTIANHNKTFMPFEEARAFVHSLELKSSDEWKKFCRGQMPENGMLHADIPRAPQHSYKTEGWKGYGDWLGTGRISNKIYRPFKEARAFVHTLKLKGVDEWYKFYRGQLPEKGVRPFDIPFNPYRTYSGKGWIGYGDWLGTGRIANVNKIYRPFKEARAFVHSLKLKGTDEWKSFCKGQMPEKGMRPADIPNSPRATYAKSGWAGMSDWLGTGRKPRKDPPQIATKKPV